mmetsp:Transcript_14034/g.25341  ORF Transcript_14034/g.25341 Transcript_14034/m.25341 type:complete len:271 (+) Transcript_14034:1403-2215(+)
MIGTGGLNSLALDRSGREGTSSLSSAFICSATESRPCATAVTYASFCMPVLRRQATRCSTSPRYSVLWNRLTLALLSRRYWAAMLSIFLRLVVLPVMVYRNERRSKLDVFMYASSTMWHTPCRSASTPSFSQHALPLLGSIFSSFSALSFAVAMLPHCRASWNLIFSSLTKCSATSGKPFFCRYAMIDLPTSLPLRMILTTVLYLHLVTATLYTYSVGSILATPAFFSRSKKCSSVDEGEIWQTYTGSSTVRMMPLSPLGSRYLMWVAVL